MFTVWVFFSLANNGSQMSSFPGPPPKLVNGPVWTIEKQLSKPDFFLVPACFWHKAEQGAHWPLVMEGNALREPGSWLQGWEHHVPLLSCWRFFRQCYRLSNEKTFPSFPSPLSSKIIRVVILLYKKQNVTWATMSWLPTYPPVPPLGWLQRKQGFLLPGSAGQSLNLQLGSAQAELRGCRKFLSSSLILRTPFTSW